MVAYTKHDLLFILDGINVSEAHAAQTNSVSGGVWTQSTIDESRVVLRSLLPNSLEPIGMRTVDGSLNNLEAGQTEFGSGDDAFPRLLDPDYRDDGQITGDGSGVIEDPFPLGNPADPGTEFVTNTDYAVSDNVVDTDPRLISNLIVDQNATNPRRHRSGRRPRRLGSEYRR